MPVFVAKYNEIRETKMKDFDEEEQQGYDMLLGTIKVPKNLRLLSERLPKSNYDKKPKKETDSHIESNHKVNKSMHI